MNKKLFFLSFLFLSVFACNTYKQLPINDPRPDGSLVASIDSVRKEVGKIPDAIYATGGGGGGNDTSQIFERIDYPGPRGYTGQRGDKGDKGDKGDQGNIQYQDFIDLPGPRGYTGQRGDKGDKGDQGNDGPAGVNSLSVKINNLYTANQAGYYVGCYATKTQVTLFYCASADTMAETILSTIDIAETVNEGHQIFLLISTNNVASAVFTGITEYADNGNYDSGLIDITSDGETIKVLMGSANGTRNISVFDVYSTLGSPVNIYPAVRGKNYHFPSNMTAAIKDGWVYINHTQTADPIPAYLYDHYPVNSAIILFASTKFNVAFTTEPGVNLTFWGAKEITTVIPFVYTFGADEYAAMRTLPFVNPVATAALKGCYFLYD